MNSFNLFLSSDLTKFGTSTNFSALLNDSRINQDNFEVALSQISFTNTEKIDLGTCHFKHYSTPESNPIITDIKIEARMGDSYKSVFEELSTKLSKIFLKNEFDRRKHLRFKNVIKESEIYFDDNQNGVTEKIILPLEKDSKYDQIAALQILASMPKFILEYYTDPFNKKLQFTLVHKLNCLNNSITYSGNIVAIIPSIGDRIFNEISGGAQHVMLDSENLPDFSMLFVETDIIENNYFENKDMQILKYFSTKTQSTPQLIDFSGNLEYKQLRFKEANERNLQNQLPPMSINISLRDKFFKSLNFKQGSILINLHFRKKL